MVAVEPYSVPAEITLFTYAALNSLQCENARVARWALGLFPKRGPPGKKRPKWPVELTSPSVVPPAQAAERAVMALAGENGTLFPGAYLTKVPQKVQRREDRLAETGGSDGGTDGGTLQSKLLDSPAKLILHEDEVLYFDYGAVRLGRKPELEDLDPKAPRPVCVGFGWLPGWDFTMSERGVPDIIPASQSRPANPPVEADEADETGPGVLGLLYKLQLEGQPSTSRSLFQKKAAVDVKDLAYAKVEDWDTAVDFHGQHKVLKLTDVYLHLFDGAVGHKYQKDGHVVPFRTPGWPIRVVIHVDPPRAQLLRNKKPKVAERRPQGDWVARELEQWVKDAILPQAYVDKVLDPWIRTDSGNQLKHVPDGGFKRFLGFS